MLATVTSATLIGVQGQEVKVEVSISSRGLPGFQIVGLPETVIKESQVRVKTALENTGMEFPLKKITVNLAPASIKKYGSGFDLPIAIGILVATGIIPQSAVDKYLIAGELSLDGEIRSIYGALPFSITARHCEKEGVLIPLKNIEEASIAQGIKVFGFSHLQEVIDFFLGNYTPLQPPTNCNNFNVTMNRWFDFKFIKGQYRAKRGMEIAAAGGHNLLFVGPPGTGKTLLARTMPSILPPLSHEEIVECTSIYSAAGFTSCIIKEPPFRTPHHTISEAGMIGGGNPPIPGEITLAHRGVLFLDELPEFKRSVLEALRQPIEDGEVTISRSGISVKFPSKFTLVASMNPCPCGFLNHPTKSCICNFNQIKKYRSKISGPLLDRIDLQIEVPPLDLCELKEGEFGESSSTIRERVLKAREIQSKRYKEIPGVKLNSQLPHSLIKSMCQLEDKAESLLFRAVEKFNISPRVFHRLLKVARTIADLAGENLIKVEHISETLQYRFSIEEEF